MRNQNAKGNDIRRYDELKRELLEALEEIDGAPWILADYPERPIKENGLLGIYTYGRLNRACSVIRALQSGIKTCDDCHRELIKWTKPGEGAQARECMAHNMMYITCPVIINGETRVFLIGQRLNPDRIISDAASASVGRLYGEPSFEQELRDKYCGYGNGEKVQVEELIKAFIEKLEIAYKHTARMDKKVATQAKKIVNSYVKKIEETNLKINWEEYEKPAEALRGGKQIFIFDPFEVSLDTVERLNEENVSELYEHVFQNHHSRINEEFDKNKNIGNLIFYKEKGEVKLELVPMGKDFLAVRKRLQDRLRKYCYSFSRPEISEEISDWLPISSVNDPPDDYYPTVELFVANAATDDKNVFKTPRIIADFDTGGGMAKAFKESGEKYSSFKFPTELAKSRGIVLSLADFIADPPPHVTVPLSGYYIEDCKVGLRWGKESSEKEVKTVTAIFINEVDWNKLRAFNINREAFVTRDIFYFFNKIRILLDVENKKTIILGPVSNRTI